MIFVKRRSGKSIYIRSHILYLKLTWLINLRFLLVIVKHKQNDEIEISF